MSTTRPALDNETMMSLYKKFLNKLSKIESNFEFTAEYRFKGYNRSKEEKFSLCVFFYDENHTPLKTTNTSMTFYAFHDIEKITSGIDALCKALKNNDHETIIELGYDV